MPLTTTMSEHRQKGHQRRVEQEGAEADRPGAAEGDEGERIGQAHRVDEDLALGLEGGEDHPHHRQQHEQRIDGDEAVHGEAEDAEAQEFRHHARREYLSCSRPRMTAMTRRNTAMALA